MDWRRPLEITLLSAVHIKNVNYFHTMDVYAVVSVSGGADTHRFITPVHKRGGNHPEWEPSPFTFMLDDAALNQNRLRLKIELVSDRALMKTQIGEVVVPVSQLLKNNSDKCASYEVLKAKGKPFVYQGHVTFGFKFGEKFRTSTPVSVQQKRPEPEGEYEYYSTTIVPLVLCVPVTPATRARLLFANCAKLLCRVVPKTTIRLQIPHVATSVGYKSTST